MFFPKNTSYLGIDIGSSSIKLVELKREKQLKLLTYGFSENIGEQNNKSVQLIAQIINKIFKESGAQSQNVIASLPTFSVFSSIINLPKMNQKDLPAAVRWEAKKVIPMSLEEMVLDWKIIQDNDDKNIKALLTGAPKMLVKKYIDIFKQAKLNLFSLETETFSLIRSLLGNDKSTIMIVELGSGTTDISIIKEGIPMLSRSIDLGGLAITRAINNAFNIGAERAEQFKYDLGITAIESNDDTVPKIIINTINPIINEVKYMISLFENQNNKKVEKIVLSGGSSLLPNFVNYLSKILNMNVIISDPWARVFYPVELKPTLLEVGPRLAVAIGLAMRQ